MDDYEKRIRDAQGTEAEIAGIRGYTNTFNMDESIFLYQSINFIRANAQHKLNAIPSFRKLTRDERESYETHQAIKKMAVEVMRKFEITLNAMGIDAGDIIPEDD